MVIDSSPLATLAVGAGLVSAGVLLAGLGVSISALEHRFWPHGDRDWTFWVGWLSWIVYSSSFVLVAYLDVGSVFTPGRVVFGVGAVLVVAGLLVSGVAVVQVGLTTSTGVATELYTQGLYRHSRNPQYVGLVAAIVGVLVCSGSAYAFVLGALGIIWFLVAPLAEEPWLQQQYGDDYDAYRERTPRFVGIPRDGHDGE